MATILASLFNLFRRKKPAPLSCTVNLDSSGNAIADNPTHAHTSACFLEFEPLAVVELFQSQGCKACPPAVPAILEATMNPNLLLLSYNVTIFDHLGWKDTFSNSASDRRQREYVKKWQRSNLFTPQIVVNGAVDSNGAGGKAEVNDLVMRARSMHKAMDWHIYLDANDTEIRIDTDRMEAEVHDIIIILYRSDEEVVKIGKGPNKGKKFKHRNMVTQYMKIGEWSGGNLTLALPSPKSSMKHGEEAAVIVQAGAGGPIVAAVKI